MKKYIYICLALILSVVFAAKVSAAFNADLKLGSSGVDVTSLQQTLISQGFDISAISSGTVQPGYFGLQTKIAVIAYQKSQGLPQTGYVGPLTRAKLNGGKSENSRIKVASPNGGEGWEIGTTRMFSWYTWNPNDKAPISIYISSNDSGCFNLKPNQTCLTVVDNKIPIAGNIEDKGSFEWMVGQHPTIAEANVRSGKYYATICKGSERDSFSCDTSDDLFEIIVKQSTDLPPSITEVRGPVSLKVGETGTWTIKARDPQGSALTYHVDWDNRPDPTGMPTVMSEAPDHGKSATFTMKYENSGTYTIGFTVYNALGFSTNTTATVNVVDAPKPITVLTPNGSEVWPVKSVRNISWDNSDKSRNSKVDISIPVVNNGDYCSGTLPCLTHYILDRNIDSNQSYNWIVATDIFDDPIPLGQYRIEVCQSGTNFCDLSDDIFTISPATQPAQ